MDNKIKFYYHPQKTKDDKKNCAIKYSTLKQFFQRNAIEFEGSNKYVLDLRMYVYVYASHSDKVEMSD